MSFRKKLLGATAAIGMLAGICGPASALSVELFNGPVTIKFSGFTTENPGTVGAGGPPLNGSAGLETTWGGGYVTTIFETGNVLNTLWQNGKSNETLSFFMYGVADVAIIQQGANDFDIYNTGCTVGPGCDGFIHIDFYRDSTAGTNPSFTANPAAADAVRASVDDRTSFSTFDGLTDGVLEMRWILVPSPLTLADPLALITTLFQNTSSATAPATGDGNFYADCIGGALCPRFNTNSQTTGIGTTADLAGNYDITPTPGNPNYPNAASNGWLIAIDDPVLTVQDTRFLEVPEPGTLALLGVALAAFGFERRRKQ